MIIFIHTLNASTINKLVSYLSTPLKSIDMFLTRTHTTTAVVTYVSGRASAAAKAKPQQQTENEDMITV